MPDNLTSSNDSQSPALPDDVAFRRIVVASTAIGFAAVLGSEACLERSAGQGFDFHWHWRALFWMAVGVAGAFRLWHLVWQSQSEANPKAHARLARFCLVVALAAAGVFIYPITFITGEQIREVLIGLSLAAAVLTFTGWMIYRVFRGFEKEDEENESVHPTDTNS